MNHYIYLFYIMYTYTMPSQVYIHIHAPLYNNIDNKDFY